MTALTTAARPAGARRLLTLGALALGTLVAVATTAQACIGVSRTITVSSFKSSMGTGSSGGIGLRRKEVVLTFDDGPARGSTTRIMKTLRAHCTKATFFPTGRMARANASLLRRLAGAGHTIAHHTHAHPNLRRMSLASAGREIDRGVASVNRALGRRGSRLFRYPYLARSRALDGVLRRKGLLPFGIGIDSNDWRGGSPRTIVNRVMGQLRRRGSGVILMHDIHSRTAKALPLLLTRLKAEGYRVVHVRTRGSGPAPSATGPRIARAETRRKRKSRRLSSRRVAALEARARKSRKTSRARLARKTTRRSAKKRATGLAAWFAKRRAARAERRKVRTAALKRSKRAARKVSRRKLRSRSRNRLTTGSVTTGTAAGSGTIFGRLRARRAARAARSGLESPYMPAASMTDTTILEQASQEIAVDAPKTLLGFLKAARTAGAVQAVDTLGR